MGATIGLSTTGVVAWSPSIYTFQEPKWGFKLEGNYLLLGWRFILQMMDLGMELGHRDSSTQHGLTASPFALYSCSHLRAQTFWLHQASWRGHIALNAQINSANSSWIKLGYDVGRNPSLQAVMHLQYPGLSPDAFGCEKTFDQWPRGTHLNQGWKGA